MRQLLIAACWLCAAGAIVARQQTPSTRSGVTLVTIDVTVLDSDGYPVQGLTAQDFEVKLDGRVQPVRTLTYVQTTASAPMVGAVGPTFDASPTPSTAIYRLAVALPADVTPGGDFAIAATVRRRGLSAHVNRHAIVAAASAADDIASAAPATRVDAPAATPPRAMSLDDQLRAAISTGQTKRGVPIALAKALRRAQDAAQIDVGVRIEIPSTVKGPLTAMFGLVNEAGAIRSGKQTIDAPSGGSYAMVFSVPVAPGRYRLRFVVADGEGAVGAVESAVAAQLAAMGPLSASDLLLSTIDGTGQEQPAPAMEMLPATAKTLTASLELYPAAGGAIPGDVLVKIALVGAGQSQPEIERVVTPEVIDGVLRGDAEFPVERLAAGTYTVQATVLVGATAVGTTSATVRK